MLNQAIIVGRLVRVEKIDDDTSKMILGVTRSFKNIEGVYNTDFIPVILKGNLTKLADECYIEGELLGIKGRLTATTEEEFGFLCDKITWLGNRQFADEYLKEEKQYDNI